LFVLSSVVGGFGGAIYGTLGNVYIDDNVKKSKAPILLCLSSFIRLLAPAVGFSMASYSLRLYIAPNLHPKITDEDPRWIGAWWLGYVAFAFAMILLSPIICMFPKILPRGALRRKQELLKKMEKQVNGTCVKVAESSFKGKYKNI
jgi:solute carrier organic anion transporter family, member 5A